MSHHPRTLDISNDASDDSYTTRRASRDMLMWAIAISVLVVIGNGVLDPSFIYEGLHQEVLAAVQVSTWLIVPEVIRRAYICYLIWTNPSARRRPSFRAVYQCDKVVLVIVACTVCSLLWNASEYFDLLLLRRNFCFLAILFIWNPISRIFQFNECELDALEKSRERRSDVGFTLALGYYFGYLRIILPPAEERTGQRDRIEEWECKEKSVTIPRDDGSACGRAAPLVNVPVRKLIILVPESGRCEQLERQCRSGDGRLSVVDNSQVGQVKRTRGGVEGRTYHNTAYRLRDPEQPMRTKYHVVVEYASPLVTLSDPLYMNTAAYGGEDLRRITYDFYISLKELLNDDRKCCEDSYSLLYYQDKDDNGGYIDLADLLLQHVEHLEVTHRWQSM